MEILLSSLILDMQALLKFVQMTPLLTSVSHQSFFTLCLNAGQKHRSSMKAQYPNPSNMCARQERFPNVLTQRGHSTPTADTLSSNGCIRRNRELRANFFPAGLASVGSGVKPGMRRSPSGTEADSTYLPNTIEVNLLFLPQLFRKFAKDHL